MIIYIHIQLTLCRLPKADDCLHIHACIHTYIHKYTHIYTHAYIVKIYIYNSPRVNSPKLMIACTYIHTYIYTYIHTSTSCQFPKADDFLRTEEACAHIQVMCMCVCIYIYIYIYICICIYVYMHIYSFV